MAAQDTFPSAVERFLRYLSSERGASPLTLKSYREDLLQLEEFLTAAACRRPGDASSTFSTASVCSVPSAARFALPATTTTCPRPTMQTAAARSGNAALPKQPPVDCPVPWRLSAH